MEKILREALAKINKLEEALKPIKAINIDEVIKDINIGLEAIEGHLNEFEEQEKEDYHCLVNNIELLVRVITKAKNHANK